MIDASSFTMIRLLSGAIILLAILNLTHKNNSMSPKGSWKSAFMLFLYAASFSFAYISLDTATGALILFGSVQITMVLASLYFGEKLIQPEWLGLLIAFSGFVYLILPEIGTPSLLGSVLMTIAGVAWGVYTLSGKGAENPLVETTFNFIRTLPLVMILFLFSFQYSTLSLKGIVFAVLSGGLASGIGYAVWYMALKGLSSIQASVVQLFVPLIAALGGVFFINETLSFRMVIASFLILGGVFVVVGGRHYSNQPKL